MELATDWRHTLILKRLMGMGRLLVSACFTKVSGEQHQKHNHRSLLQIWYLYWRRRGREKITFWGEINNLSLRRTPSLIPLSPLWKSNGRPLMFALVVSLLQFHTIFNFAWLVVFNIMSNKSKISRTHGNSRLFICRFEYRPMKTYSKESNHNLNRNREILIVIEQF